MPYVEVDIMHVICFTRLLPLFSCSVEEIREPGDEAIDTQCFSPKSLFTLKLKCGLLLATCVIPALPF